MRIGAIATAIVIGAGLLVAGSPAASAAARTPSAAVVVARAAAASCSTGKYQKQVEGYLRQLGYGKLSVDGRQSSSDCAAIKKFQSRYGIKPVSGLAGPTTHGVAKRLAGTKVSSCKASRSKVTVCVDLTHQTVFVLKKGGGYLLKPTVTRTGMKRYATPKGTYRIGQRANPEYSEKYKVNMYNWQRFNGGIGLHRTTTYLHDSWRGSHGCVNLLKSDAVFLYGKLKKGTTVKVYGRRPGT
ncbi:L,D-transpeptidase family protein [Actinoplanes sp. NPDC051470]|uniref:L,D-transpeptidase family protein n=1 Tax=Actinoplanes sp. NPDC051470 TaxID=3157224 RepID=UPI003425C6AD